MVSGSEPMNVYVHQRGLLVFQFYAQDDPSLRTWSLLLLCLHFSLYHSSSSKTSLLPSHPQRIAQLDTARSRMCGRMFYPGYKTKNHKSLDPISPLDL